RPEGSGTIPAAFGGHRPEEGLLPGARAQVPRRTEPDVRQGRAERTRRARARALPARVYRPSARRPVRALDAAERLEALAGGGARDVPSTAHRKLTMKRPPRTTSISIAPWRCEEPRYCGEPLTEEASVDCGWGTLIFGHTFSCNERLIAAIEDEQD